MKMLISNTELNSKKSREQIPLECLHCQKIHYRPKNIILRILNGSLKNTNKGCYCSQKCKNDHRANSKTYNCKHCGKEIKRTPSQIRSDKIFCSSSCSATYFNKDKIIWKKCLICKEPFRPYKGIKKMKYCSSLCSNQKRKKDTYEKIENGTYKVMHGERTLRNYLIEKHGAKCMECGWDKINPKSNKPTIQVEHIDGNSENNNLSNLKLLCPNCHSLTPTFGSLNKGSGRYYRRLRYAAGKSS